MKAILILSIVLLFSSCSEISNEKIKERAPIDESEEISESKEVKTETRENKEDTEKIKVEVENIRANSDFNGNGIDDYADMVNGARKDAKNHPKYDLAYVGTNNGYPDTKTGVCTNVIWRAFREAGYSLRSMLNDDILRDRYAYTNISGEPDPYIDFRRVKTLRPLFEKYFISLETNLNDTSQWQPGDIILFNPNDFHIGILSDKRNDDGFPLVFHNMGQRDREEDYLTRKKDDISGHFSLT